MKTNKKDKKKKTVINPAGSLGIEHAAEFKEQLTSALETYKHVVIDLEKTESLHLSILQILHSAFTSRLNTKLTMEGHDSEHVRSALEDNGFICTGADCPEQNSSNFWITGEKQ